MSRRITLQARIEPLQLAEPFRIFGHSFHHVDVVRVDLRDGPHLGRGEAAGVYYLGDKPDTLLAQVESVRDEIEAGLTRDALRQRLPAGGARNALDCALWELEARRAGSTVAALIGLPALLPLTTTVTLGAESPAQMRACALRHADFHALKLKLTGEPELDAARVSGIREARPGVWIGVDANQAYTSATLEALIPTLVAADVALLEQPFARGREADMDGIARIIPLAADESVQDLAELERFAPHFDVVNIKLDKCGGLTEGLLMQERARQLGLKVMVGCMVGSSLAATPGFLLGQRCDLVDLDNVLFLAADHAPGVQYRQGQVSSSAQVWG